MLLIFWVLQLIEVWNSGHGRMHYAVRFRGHIYRKQAAFRYLYIYLNFSNTLLPPSLLGQGGLQESVKQATEMLRLR